MKLSIIVCVFNEIATIRTALESLRAVDLGAWEREIIVVDNCSTDGTRKFLETLDYLKMPDVRVILNERNLGKGGSIRVAINALEGDYAVIHDADLEYDPADHVKMLAEVERGALAVFGSRTLGGEVVYEYAQNYWAVRFLTGLTNVLFGGHLTDVATALKLARADILKALNLKTSGFDLDFELPCKLLRAGVDIREVAVSYKPRTAEEGKKIRPIDGVSALRVILWERLGLSRIWKGEPPAL
jgi:glycosyltransferase involved in cell wall biosynthesis